MNEVLCWRWLQSFDWSLKGRHFWRPTESLVCLCSERVRLWWFWKDWGIFSVITWGLEVSRCESGLRSRWKWVRCSCKGFEGVWWLMSLRGVFWSWLWELSFGLVFRFLNISKFVYIWRVLLFSFIYATQFSNWFEKIQYLSPRIDGLSICTWSDSTSITCQEFLKNFSSQHNE